MSDLRAYLNSVNYSSNGTGNTVTLICDEPVDVTTTDGDYKDFFITVRPGAFATGFKVTVKYEGLAEPVEYDQFWPGSAHWNYDSYYFAPGVHRYPRQFTVRPGYSIGIRVN